MKVLFIGGTGIISTACTQLAAEQGIDLTLLTRGQRPANIPHGIKTLRGNVNDPSVMEELRRTPFDVVVNWIGFTTADIERDLRLFEKRVQQYIFISSASVYQKPPTHYLITESTPLANPYWEYSRNKIACEERLLTAYREKGFPVTMVRPSLTYGETMVPLVLNSWMKPYTAVHRMLRGEKVIVPGDGSSLWVVTHDSDFARGFMGLIGHAEAIGHAFHITSDEVLTWNQLFQTVGAALGMEPKLVHIPSDFLVACRPELEGTLIGDKSNSVVFDNTKIKRFVPGFCATTTFDQGIRKSIAWFEADAARKQIDAEASTTWDKLIALYEKGLREAVSGCKI
jgi:nucleoside-diphosphate-sugar epimerase